MKVFLPEKLRIYQTDSVHALVYVYLTFNMSINHLAWPCTHMGNDDSGSIEISDSLRASQKSNV